MARIVPIHEMVRAYRNDKKWGVRQFAKEVGISPASVSRFENGHPLDQINMIKLLVWLFGGNP